MTDGEIEIRNPRFRSPSGAREAVYRLYDEQGVLLYVGRAGCPELRFASHRNTKSWWPQVARRTAVWYDTRIEARSAEAVAIEAESPLRNIRREPLPIRLNAIPGGWLHMISEESAERQLDAVLAEIDEASLHVAITRYQPDKHCREVCAVLVPSDWYAWATGVIDGLKIRDGVEPGESGR